MHYDADIESGAVPLALEKELSRCCKLFSRQLLIHLNLKVKIKETGDGTPIERLDKNKTVGGGDTGGDPNTSKKQTQKNKK